MIFEFTKQAMFKLSYILLFVFCMIPAIVQSVSPHNLTWTEYHPLHHHQEYLHYLQKEFPNIVQVENIGITHEERPILLLKICAHRKCGKRPAIWIDGGIHGREWISPAAVSFLANELVVWNKDNKYVTKIFDWYILTVANPDGYARTFSGYREWRKNANPTHAKNCSSKFGVDLNRLVMIYSLLFLLKFFYKKFWLLLG